MLESATGLYTQDQIDYVNSVKDEDLRSVLLHHVRLKDNAFKDRDAFEKAANEWPTVAKAIERIKSELSADKEEGSYFHSWQANIAMAFKDEFDRKAKEKEPVFTKWLFTENGVHEIANNAAKEFLNLLIQ